MTDKEISKSDQIIIDGVDVSGCEYYFDEKCRCMDASIMQDFYSCPQCNSNPNCNYKNWKRKEQECEKAKKIIETAVDDFNLEYGTPQYDRLLNGAKSLGIEVKDYE